ncbi:hypothetical protein BBP40_000676 [Aspergillus hancockii]|nr:hypothetical protein BBP40_000676 [Aspergillus hancockii]
MSGDNQSSPSSRNGSDSLRQPRRCWSRSLNRGMAWTLMLLLVTLVSPASAALVKFDNCLPAPTIASNPKKLQFVPLDVTVVFDLNNSLHNLNITVYGNVSGTADQSTSYPSPDDPQWTNPNATVGKIVNLDQANYKWSTLLTTVDVVSFSPYRGAAKFCDSLTQGECPLGPVFYANASDLSSLRAFSVQHDMLSSYRMSTLSSTLLLKSGNAAATELGCISVDITPDLGSALRSALAYVPLVILILVGFATVTAAIYSPWGTTNPFHWTSNYGRDEDVLRLVTPGFGDCLQYMQFAVLTGALSLNYPGYYQPVVSQVAWSTLMFNQSFLSPGNETNPVQDGVYTVNGTYGLDALQQYVGMESARDIWPGMMIWLLAVVVAVTLLIQLSFAFRWLHREFSHNSEEDLRSKNMPFTVGNVIRIVCNYLFLPLISLSFFQLVIAGQSPAYCVALAVVVILIMLAFAIWVIRLIATTRPKSYLFDDLPTVLLYGPLYNTFCDDAAAFTVVSLFLSFARGVAIGALQPSGIAQIVLLAICEVVAILTLVAFRPFPSPTSMNLYHACFSIVRFLTILLSVVFVPSLGVSQAARGWIGYVILFLHALVLVFGFFLNALQTLVEVIARLAGAGGYEGGVTRGGLVKVFGMRQLSRRTPRRSVGTRQSMGSEAAMLAHTDERLSSQFDGSRPRSLSGSSALLLNRAAASEPRTSAFYESGSAHGAYIPAPKDDLDLDDPRQSRKDYAVREVDFYYRVRGPPLSQSGTRKLKTGPADPTGPVSSATGFFRNLFRGKTKESGKGFEVVRSARAPPPGLIPEGDDVHEPYTDEPDEQGIAGHSRRVSDSDLSYQDTDGEDNNRIGEALMSLPQVESGGAIELPSRVGSQRSSHAPSGVPEAPLTPRHDVRTPTPDDEAMSHKSLPVVTKAVLDESHYPSGQLHPSSSGTGRLPFSAASSPSRDRNLSIASTTPSTSSSRRHGHGGNRTERPSSVGYVAQHRTRDYIHEASPDEPTFTGSAAELVDEPHHHEGKY